MWAAGTKLAPSITVRICPARRTVQRMGVETQRRVPEGSWLVAFSFTCVWLLSLCCPRGAVTREHGNSLSAPSLSQVACGMQE
jgi:hypothetical protein